MLLSGESELVGVQLINQAVHGYGPLQRSDVWPFRCKMVLMRVMIPRRSFRREFEQVIFYSRPFLLNFVPLYCRTSWSWKRNECVFHKKCLSLPITRRQNLQLGSSGRFHYGCLQNAEILWASISKEQLTHHLAWKHEIELVGCCLVQCALCTLLNDKEAPLSTTLYSGEWTVCSSLTFSLLLCLNDLQ